MLLLRLLRRFREVRASVVTSWWLFLLRRPCVLEQSTLFYPHRAAWVVRCVVSGTVNARWVVVRAFRVLSALLAFMLGVFCRSIFGTSVVYAPWFTAAAA